MISLQSQRKAWSALTYTTDAARRRARVIICKGQILLEKRKNDPSRGKWSVPGGLVELGKKCGQAVVREVREETGLTVEKPEHIDAVDNIERDENGRVKYHFVIVDYFVKLKGGKLGASSDAAELRGVSLEDVKKYALTKTFREFYKRNCKKLAALESCP